MAKKSKPLTAAEQKKQNGWCTACPAGVPAAIKKDGTNGIYCADHAAANKKKAKARYNKRENPVGRPRLYE